MTMALNPSMWLTHEQHAFFITNIITKIKWMKFLWCTQCKAFIYIFLLWRTLSHPQLQENYPLAFLPKIQIKWNHFFCVSCQHTPTKKTKSFRYNFQKKSTPKNKKITFVFSSYHKFFLLYIEQLLYCLYWEICTLDLLTYWSLCSLFLFTFFKEFRCFISIFSF